MNQDFSELYRYYGFYENELRQNILGFWLPRCEDREAGGFVNCFDNCGRQLLSYDKYTWSQGRFVWLFSRLACTSAPMFNWEEREEFLRLAGQGAAFLMQHCLLGPEDYRCTFLMERDGTAKRTEPGAPLDRSIYADCFAILGLAMYSYAAHTPEAYQFAKKLYCSAVARVRARNFNTLPYPLSAQYRAHGIPMIFSNVTRELYRAAELLDKAFAPALLEDLEGFTTDVLEHFTDRNDRIHEVIYADNRELLQILGQHMNPGHTLEDVWFELDSAQLLGKQALWNEKLYRICKQALASGWDEEYGGLLHFCAMQGGAPDGDTTGVADEPMTRQLAGWGDKLWWVHSEALYTTLRCALETGDAAFWQWHEKIFTYTYQTFPYRDPEIREWTQICTREGRPQDKVVALPVKDPFHIARNLILSIELLSQTLSAHAGIRM